MNTRCLETTGLLLARVLLLVSLLALPLAPSSAMAVSTTWEVTSLANDGPGSLRQQITNASPGDRIVFADGLNGEIQLTTNSLFIQKNLTIIGPAAGAVTVNGLNSRRIFYIARVLDPIQVTIEGLSLRGGYAYEGGAIYNTANLELRSMTIYSNTAQSLGGGIFSEGDLTLTNVTVSGNTSGGDGAGIYFKATSPYSTTITFEHTTLTANTAGGLGGGLAVSNLGGAGGKTTRIFRSVLAGNTDGPDMAPDCYTGIGAQLLSDGYNLVGVTDNCNFNPTGSDSSGTLASPIEPRLGPLADNGGQGLTHRPDPDSPVVDAAGSGCLPADQRGFPRPLNGNADNTVACDIGAFERASTPPALIENQPQTLAEGSLLPLNGTMLLSTDIETGADQLFYSLVTSPTNGTLWLGDHPMAPGETFSQTSLTDGKVVFAHDGSEQDFANFEFLLSELTTPRLDLVSWRQDGLAANHASTNPAISAEGRWVAYQSSATDIVPMDNNNAQDIFLYDRLTDSVQRVSVDYAGTEGNSPSADPAISADGRYVVFSSLADNLDSDDGNQTYDVFRHDTFLHQTWMVSLNSTGFQGNQKSISPTISADGRYVAFLSWATNLVPTDTNQVADVFVYDIELGNIERVSVNNNGEESQAAAEGRPAISASGRFIAFTSAAGDLVAGDDNGVADVFVHDRTTGLTRRVSTGPGGTNGDGPSWAPAISANGSTIAFVSTATNLVAGDDNNLPDVFIHDLATQTTERVSLSSTGQQANGASYDPSLSADGSRAAFWSLASNLAPGDDNFICDLDGDGTANENCPDVFIHDRPTSQTRRVSVTSTGASPNGPAWDTALAANGRQVAFNAQVTNLVAGDDNPYCGPMGTGPCSDIFTYDSGAVQDVFQIQVTPTNDPPAVTAISNSPSAYEGSSVSFSGSFYDPDLSGSAVITWSFGDGAYAYGTLNPTHVYLDNGSYNVTMLVDDGEGGIGGGQLTQEVINAAPTVDAGQNIRVAPGTLVTIRGSFTDPGAGDTWTATIDFDADDGPQPLTLNPDGTFEASFLYPFEGLYRVTVRVQDDDEGTGIDEVNVQVGDIFLFLPIVSQPPAG